MNIRQAAQVLFLALAGAVRASPQATLQQFRVEENNGRLNFWRPLDYRPDDNYTQGAIFGAILNTAPHWLEFGQKSCREKPADDPACTQLRLELAQRMYTPNLPTFGPNRPYAGVLDAEVERRSVTPRRLFAVGTLLGVTGPPSRAQTVQSWFHRRFDYPTESGWDYQISTAALVNVDARADWLLTPAAPSWIAVTGGAAATAGNLLTSATLASEARLGWHVPHPWYPDSQSRSSWRAYAIFGSQLDGVVRSLVIDGNNQWTLGRVQREGIVQQTVWGGAVGLGAFNAVFRATSRGADYHGGHWHEWTSLAIVYGQP